MQNKFFEKANICWSEGMLVINATRTSMECRHYNVHTRLNSCGILEVYAFRPDYRLNWAEKTPIDVNLVMDKDVEEVKKYFWSKTKIKRAREGWIELKQASPRHFSSNNFVIIE